MIFTGFGTRQYFLFDMVFLSLYIYIFRGASSWLFIVPWGIRKNIKWLSKKYPNIPIYITENGVSDEGEINDNMRVEYFKNYINEVLKCKLYIGKFKKIITSTHSTVDILKIDFDEQYTFLLS